MNYKKISLYDRFEIKAEEMRINQMYTKGWNLKKAGFFNNEYEYLEDENDDKNYIYIVLAIKKSRQQDAIEELKQYDWEYVCGTRHKLYLKKECSDETEKQARYISEEIDSTDDNTQNSLSQEENNIIKKYRKSGIKNRVINHLIKMIFAVLCVCMIMNIDKLYEQYGIVLEKSLTEDMYIKSVNSVDNKIYMDSAFEVGLAIANTLKAGLITLIIMYLIRMIWDVVNVRAVVIKCLLGIAILSYFYGCYLESYIVDAKYRWNFYFAVEDGCKEIDIIGDGFGDKEYVIGVDMLFYHDEILVEKPQIIMEVLNDNGEVIVDDKVTRILIYDIEDVTHVRINAYDMKTEEKYDNLKKVRFNIRQKNDMGEEVVEY